MKGLPALYATILSVVAIGTASAQQSVGYPPSRSPYLDIEQTQEISLFGGYYKAHHDPAGVAPQSAMISGLHYAWRAGGPAHLTVDFSRINSQQSLIDPAKIGAARDLGTVNRPLYSLDAGLGMSLTGARTWHHISPMANLGLGLISDFHSQPDSLLGGYKFGTRFAFTWGAGVRWIPTQHGKFLIRADINNRLFTIKYPETFYVAPTGGTAVLPASQARSFWTNNPAFTLGVARLF